MIKKALLFACATALTGAVAMPAWSAVSAQDAARLGAELTPLGAEKGANAAGTIPAWDGGLDSAAKAGFANFKPGSHHLDQNFLFRPVAGYSRYRMPVANLYMCGAATWPGAGTGAGSGYLLGKMLAGR